MVLNRVSFRIEGGEGRIIGLRGPNGAGKSTFLKACLGLVAIRSGTLRFAGLEPGGKKFRKLLARVGYVPQSRPPGQLRLTVDDVVALGRYGRVGFFGRYGASDGRAVEAAKRKAGVAGIGTKAIQELSGGQYQRVMIAKALAAEPLFLLLDEPGVHLDAKGRDDISELLVSIARDKAASMLLVSHSAKLLSHCDSFLDFEGGRIGVSHV
ncbi:MAG TPA: ATP-binding cassette domain-containing protein [Rectinemataceae bacterium]|nr:ATP-binding cassette domain-containing protein [Rectinemataceae bacterium]